MSGLINLIAGLYIKPNYIHWRKFISVLASVMLNLSPLILVLAFFTEPVHASPMRPLTFSGIFLSAAGVLFMFLPKIRLKD
jgi:O-antigen/teichoic acid export membrane protein